MTGLLRRIQCSYKFLYVNTCYSGVNSTILQRIFQRVNVFRIGIVRNNFRFYMQFYLTLKIVFPYLKIIRLDKLKIFIEYNHEQQIVRIGFSRLELKVEAREFYIEKLQSNYAFYVQLTNTERVLKKGILTIKFQLAKWTEFL